MIAISTLPGKAVFACISHNLKETGDTARILTRCSTLRVLLQYSSCACGQLIQTD
jgi:hypothetical protein